MELMFEVGDKVRFIDEALEGIVAAILGKDNIEVITTDGFTIVAPASQLVKVREENEKKTMSRQYVAEPVKQPVIQAKRPVRSKAFSFDDKNSKEEIIYAAFELLDAASPMTSALQLHIINNSSQAIAFALTKKYEMRDEGIALEVLMPRTVKSFFTYTQDDLKMFDSFRIQVIFYPPAGVKSMFRSPVQKTFRYVIEDVFENADLLVGDTNSHLVQLFDITKPSEVDITPLMNRFADATKPEDIKKAKLQKQEHTIIYSDEKIVDLHIEELIKDFKAMSNSQIIVHQLKHFQFEMDQALLRHLKKITFIHGVGTGVLKSAIHEELKKYSNIKYGDAPVEKFGYGATEIVFE